MLRLLQLPDFIQAALRDESITAGHARALINLKREDDQRKILSSILKKYLSVRQTEELVRNFDKKRDQKTKVRRSEEHTSELQSRGHLVCRLLLEKKNNTC